MIEKIIKIESIPLVDFYGVGQVHMKMLEAAFPKTKMIHRGNEMFLQGTELDLNQIATIVQSFIDHYEKYGHLNTEVVQYYVANESVEESQLDSDIIVHGHKGNIIKAKTPNQLKLVQAVKQNDLVFALGPAGTGKTFVSVAMAVRALKNKEVRKIVFTRPAVEAGENLGFLPGDLKEKIDPFLRPIYDALEEMIPAEKLKLYQETNVIEIAPLAYMRGRTLNNAFILLDEAQNTTPMQLKMFLTRMGVGSKVIVNGDKSQIDLPTKQKSGLIEALDVLKKIQGISVVEFTAKDVTRHKLVKDIIMAYDAYHS